jgi:hypothetical protein
MAVCAQVCSACGKTTSKQRVKNHQVCWIFVNVCERSNTFLHSAHVKINCQNTSPSARGNQCKTTSPDCGKPGAKTTTSCKRNTQNATHPPLHSKSHKHVLFPIHISFAKRAGGRHERTRFFRVSFEEENLQIPLALERFCERISPV